MRLNFCTYLTIYSGDRLPPFYVGSSTVEKVVSGYRGSVSSKEFGKTWKEELKNNPHLFRTIILKRFDNKKESLEEEKSLQIKLNAIKNDLFVNRSYAQKDGFFGRDVSGEKNPMFNRHHREDSKLKQSFTRKSVDENKRIEKFLSKMSEKINGKTRQQLASEKMAKSRKENGNYQLSKVSIDRMNLTRIEIGLIPSYEIYDINKNLVFSGTKSECVKNVPGINEKMFKKLIPSKNTDSIILFNGNYSKAQAKRYKSEHLIGFEIRRKVK